MIVSNFMINYSYGHYVINFLEKNKNKKYTIVPYHISIIMSSYQKIFIIVLMVNFIFEQGKTAILFGILNLGFLAAVLCVTYFLLNEDMRINATGYMASGLNIIMYGSPLAGMVSKYDLFFAPR